MQQSLAGDWYNVFLGFIGKDYYFEEDDNIFSYGSKITANHYEFWLHIRNKNSII